MLLSRPFCSTLLAFILHLSTSPTPPQFLTASPLEKLALWKLTERAVVWRDRSKVPIFALDKLIHQNLSLASVRICNCLKPRQLHLLPSIPAPVLLFFFFVLMSFLIFLFSILSLPTQKDDFGRHWSLHFHTRWSKVFHAEWIIRQQHCYHSLSFAPAWWWLGDATGEICREWQSWRPNRKECSGATWSCSCRCDTLLQQDRGGRAKCIRAMRPRFKCT